MDKIKCNPTFCSLIILFHLGMRCIMEVKHSERFKLTFIMLLIQMHLFKRALIHIRDCVDWCCDDEMAQSFFFFPLIMGNQSRISLMLRQSAHLVDRYEATEL